MTFRAVERRPLPWREPLAAAAGLRHRDGALALLSDGGPLGRWSFVAADPDRVVIEPVETGLDRLRDPDFADGAVGLLAYDAGARPATGPRPSIWPDLMLARYPSMLVFDHRDRTVLAVGRGADVEAARAAAGVAQGWFAVRAPERGPTPPPPAARLNPEAPSHRLMRPRSPPSSPVSPRGPVPGNIARAWTGALHSDADPFDVLLRLADRASAYGAFWRLGDRAIVSNSPELFLTLDGDRIETRPIKGTRPRDPDPARDAALADDLQASAKDRAENLMIVDLMRNDLARAAVPGSVAVERLFEVERLATVHHLVSTVTARARPGVGPADLLEATFPPGSITGAPKHQAMKVIAGHEPPRGPWCGSLFHIADGRMTASVLIRTAAFERMSGKWRFRTLAGAGIVADSDPAAELAETEAKIRALREALTGD